MWPCCSSEARTRGRTTALTATVTVLAAVAALAPALLAVAGGSARQEQPAAGRSEAPLDWLAVLVGPSHGTLEPCGCAGGMLGGIDRLASAVRVQSQSRSAPSLAVGTGGLVSEAAVASGLVDWQRAQSEAGAFALGSLGLDALGVSSHELSLARAELEQLRGYAGATPFVATNVFDAAGAPPFEPAVRHAATGVAVLCFVADGAVSVAPEGAAGGAWTSVAPAAALARHTERGTDLGTPGRRLVLVEGDAARAAEVAALVDAADVVAWFGGKGDASHGLEPVGPSAAPRPGGFVGDRLRHVVSVRARGTERAWESHPVDAALPSDEQAAFARELYREFLRDRGVVSAYAAHLGDHPRGAFAGSESCKACHAVSHGAWAESAHAHALDTLARDLRGAMPATVDPACVRCHTVGFGYATGFAAGAAAPRDPGGPLGAVGCESCHGPGARHAASGAATDIVRSSAATCMECHDSENDPNFDFERKWPLIAHDEG